MLPYLQRYPLAVWTHRLPDEIPVPYPVAKHPDHPGGYGYPEPFHRRVTCYKCYILRSEENGNDEADISENRHISGEFRIKIHTADRQRQNVSNVNADIGIAPHDGNHKREGDNTDIFQRLYRNVKMLKHGWHDGT